MLVSEAYHPYWEHWWPPGHMIGWEHTFVHELTICSRRSGTTATWGRTAPTWRTATAAAEVCDAIVRSDESEAGSRHRTAFVRAAVVQEIGTLPEAGKFPTRGGAEEGKAARSARGRPGLDRHRGLREAVLRRSPPSFMQCPVRRAWRGSRTGGGLPHGDGLGTTRNGTFAEHVLFAPDEAFPVPDGLGPESRSRSRPRPGSRASCR